ncbi:DUF3027 domain-containing protein [Bifidobacterium sp. ESL0790]|uniref:DUF3027 domain-containing protein n=1 Tax=Bifidobacterium sp. ESL0790 TaxID=2983233 RepID=UPI0023F7B6D2|nr:DUF3027 domain-containing protein [Bifidobacterium sp. ESL0790]WEV71853.1 DUF3027 domain-containing protein [Bifidobacterium sp. ESL0790]
MTEDTKEDTLEDSLDPKALAKSVAIVSADEPEDVGDFATQVELGDNVTDFRFVCLKRGYEGWQWAVTLYHDEDRDTWTVNESTLVPTDESLLAPAWVPWKDRLEAKDISVTDVLGTDPNDPRMEDGFRHTEAGESGGGNADDGQADKADKTDGETDGDDSADGKADKADGDSETSSQAGDNADAKTESGDIDPETGLSVDAEEAIEDFHLSRRHVMSPMGRSQTAQRWYQGQHGPKSLSTKTSEGNLCSTCAFFIGLKGDLNTMFGLCANRWSPDDGRVVSVDHGCGEHSEIEESEPTRLWVQSKPAFDDLHIDIIAQKPREERGQVELIEALDGDDADADTAVDETDEDTANDDDIKRHAVPASLEDETDDDGDSDDDDTEVEAEVSAVTDVESTIDLSNDDSDNSDDSDDDDESDDDDSDSDNSDDSEDDSDDSEDSDEDGDDTDADDSDEDDEPDDTDDSDESDEDSDDDASDDDDTTDDSDDSDKSDDPTATDTDDDASNRK